MTSQHGFSHHFLLPLIAVLAVGAIGWWLTFGSKAAVPSPAPKQGWVDDGAYVSKNPSEYPSTARNYNTIEDGKDYTFAVNSTGLRHTVLNVGIGELVNVESSWPYTTTYKTDSIESRIAQVTRWNAANPSKKVSVHLRFHVGKSAPQVWKDVCGTVTMKDGSFAVTADAPRWWVKDTLGRDTYQKLYENAMVALAGAVDTINSQATTRDVIGSVNAPGAAPNYPEPMIIYANDRTERKLVDGRWETIVGTNENLRAAGFSAEAHNNFMLWFPTAARHFNKVAVELAVNPYQNIKADGSLDARTATMYKEVSQKLIDTVHGRAVIANYSAREAYFDPRNTSRNAYKSMYDWMVDVKSRENVWIGVQLARPPRVANTVSPRITSDNTEKWDDVAKWAAQRGFNFVETTGPKVTLKVNGITQSGKANVWPGSYNDDDDDIRVMTNINRALRSNDHP